MGSALYEAVIATNTLEASRLLGAGAPINWQPRASVSAQVQDASSLASAELTKPYRWSLSHGQGIAAALCSGLPLAVVQTRPGTDGSGAQGDAAPRVL